MKTKERSIIKIIVKASIIVVVSIFLFYFLSEELLHLRTKGMVGELSYMVAELNSYHLKNTDYPEKYVWDKRISGQFIYKKLNSNHFEIYGKAKYWIMPNQLLKATEEGVFLQDPVVNAGKWEPIGPAHVMPNRTSYK